MVLAIRKGDGRWGLPFGKINPNEAALPAALRETFEETGLEVCEVSVRRNVWETNFEIVQAPFIDNRAYTFRCEPTEGWPSNAYQMTIPGAHLPDTFPRLVSSKEGQAGWCVPGLLACPNHGGFFEYNRKMFDYFGVNWRIETGPNSPTVRHYSAYETKIKTSEEMPEGNISFMHPRFRKE
jgi:hypothetical protein